MTAAAGAVVKGAAALPWVAPATFEGAEVAAAGGGAKVIELGIAAMIAGFCLTWLAQMPAR